MNLLRRLLCKCFGHADITVEDHFVDACSYVLPAGSLAGLNKFLKDKFYIQCRRCGRVRK